MEKLPHEIILIILQYLYDPNRYFHHDLFAWFSSNRSFALIRRSVCVWGLNPLTSLCYHQQESFRNYLHSKLHSPTNQIGLTLMKINLTDLSHLRSIYILKLYDCREMNSLTMTELIHLHTLILIRCRQVHHIEGVEHVQKLIILENFKWKEVKVVANIPSLTLYRCTAIEDYQPILWGKHDYLDLSFTPCLSFIHGICQSKVVKLIGCTKLIEIYEKWNEGEVEEAHFSSTAIHDVRNLRHIPKLFLDSCPNVRDLGPLVNVKYLDLSRNHQIEDVSMLEAVRVLRIKDCPNITGLDKLLHLRVLYIDSVMIRKVQACDLPPQVKIVVEE